MKMLRNFVFGVCNCKANWKTEKLIEKGIQEIKNVVGNKKAIMALSDGIDSSTASVLATKTLGKNLTAVFVDHGFMREGEPEFVKATFEDLGMNLILVKAQKRFLDKLKGIIDPEKKNYRRGIH